MVKIIPPDSGCLSFTRFRLTKQTVAAIQMLPFFSYSSVTPKLFSFPTDA